MKQTVYETKSVHSLILYFSVPAIFSLIVEMMAAVVDTAFAGHLGEDSVAALTTMGLLSPVLSIYTAVQALFAVSTSIMIAKYLKDQKVREEYFLTGLWMTVFVSAGVSAGSCLIMPELFSFLGISGEILIFAEKYLKIQLYSNVLSAVGYTLTSCIRAFGYPGIEMLLTGAAVLTNIIFNAVFVFGMGMGFVGLAYGTLVSELFCCVTSAWWICKHRLFRFQCTLPWRIFKKDTVELLKLGIAQTVIQSLAGCTAFFVNRSLMIYTTLQHVAVWNVVQKVYTLFLMPIVGITQGVQTIIAYFDGHEEQTKKKKTLTATVCDTVFYGLAALGIVFFFGEPLLSLFAGTEKICQLGSEILRIVFSTFPLMGIFYTIMTLYEVTGHEGKAVFLILTRQVFLMIPLTYLLPKIFPEISAAVFCAVPAADLMSMLIAVMMRKNKENKHANLSD